jgi:hypothetical protein
MRVLVATAIATLPDGADPQTAGETIETQLEEVLIAPAVRVATLPLVEVRFVRVALVPVEVVKVSPCRALDPLTWRPPIVAAAEDRFVAERVLSDALVPVALVKVKPASVEEARE